MIRGTTPTLRFKIPYCTRVIDLGYVTFSRKGEVFKDIPFSDSRVSVRDGAVLVSLTQKDTLEFNSRATYSVQLRILLKNNIAVASNIIPISIGAILKNGILK